MCACPPNVNGTVSSNGVCYALYNNSLDWFHAEAACAGEGGNLANIPDAFTNSFISSYAKSILGFQSYWIGGLADSTGNYSYWEWIDYKSFKYTNWAPGNEEIFKRAVLFDELKARQKIFRSASLYHS